MSNLNHKIIYSLKIHIQLQSMGFKSIAEMRNPQNQNFNCWVYEATPELLKAFDQIVGGMHNG